MPTGFVMNCVLFCSVKESHYLTSRAILINAEGTFLRTGGVAGSDLILRPPEDGLIKGVIHRHIGERRF